jgi:hypothetical protein
LKHKRSSENYGKTQESNKTKQQWTGSSYMSGEWSRERVLEKWGKLDFSQCGLLQNLS